MMGIRIIFVWLPVPREKTTKRKIFHEIELFPQIKN
jgi:hypothetical protein